MRLAFVSDTHLGFARGSVREGDAFLQLKQALEGIAAQQPDAIIHPGDFFDHKIPIQEVWDESFQCLRVIQQAPQSGAIITHFPRNGASHSFHFRGIPLIAIAGTHEYRAKDFKNALQVLQGAQLKISEVNLRVESSGVTVTNWKIGGPNEVEQADCAIDSGNMTLLTCPIIQDNVNTLAAGSGRVLSIYGTVAAGSNIPNPSLRLSVEAGGTIAGGGFIRWTDGTSTFTWIDSPQVFPVRGALWSVAK
jgi:hypothetical protein